MRVKNWTYFLAVAALLGVSLFATSCERDNREEPVVEKEAISFRSAQSNGEGRSRVVIADDEALQSACSSGEGIGVWGIVNDDVNTNASLLDNVKLTFDTAISDWTYEPTQYWIRGAKHDFWAIYPYSAADCSLNPTTGILTRTNITLGTTNPANNVDYMCAVSSRDLADPAASTGPVPLELRHAMSLLEFRFVNAMGFVDAVTDISLNGHLYKASLAFARDGVLEGTTDGLVDILVTPTGDLAEANLFQGQSLTNIDKNISTSHNLFGNVGSIVVLPQEVEGKSVFFNLTVNSSPSNINLGILPITEWLPGKKYVYTVTLTTSTITCDVIVVDWIKDEVELVPVE